MRTLAITLLVALVGLAGCLEGSDGPAVDLDNDLLGPIVLEASVVDAAVDMTGDLYEPTMEVCDDGSIYITGHTILVDTTGAPVFGSHDGGETWEQLPWFQDQTMPEPVHGATPPVSDEIFLACGDDGWLYGGDITLATYPVNAWSGYGTMHEYWNFNAYNEADVAQEALDGDCVARPAKDRPWTAYSNGTLLVTSNPAGAENQIGVVSVPFAAPSPVSYGTAIDGIEWNLCAGPGGSIPGVPDISSQGDFAAPQLSGGNLWMTVGNADDVHATENIAVFETSTGGEITSVYGHAAFDKEDTLFVGITNNTAADEAGNQTGQIQLAVSLDAGQTYVNETFVTGDLPLRHFWMDPNDFGAGALIVWAVDHMDNDTRTGFDWFMAHVFADEAGAPYMDNVFMVIENGPAPSAHVTGAAVGPDGRAYTAMYTTGSGSVAAPTTPLEVYIQRSGPTLPVSMDLVEAIEAPVE